jgi:hypothetical protein
MAGPETPDDDWSVTGEIPSVDENWLVGPAREHFESTAGNLGRSLDDDHEVSTEIDNTFHSILSKHKKEIAAGVLAGLTVAGVFAATRQLRIRRKTH